MENELDEEEDPLGVEVAVVVVVTVAIEGLMVAETTAAESEESCACTASAPALKASPVLPSVKLLPQQFAFEVA